MKVSPEQLRSLASTMQDIGSGVQALDIRTKINEIGTALPGSGLGEVAATAADHIEGAWLRMAMRCTRISNICHGNAGTFEVTDADFRDKLTEMGDGIR